MYEERLPDETLRRRFAEVLDRLRDDVLRRLTGPLARTGDRERLLLRFLAGRDGDRPREDEAIRERLGDGDRLRDERLLLRLWWYRLTGERERLYRYLRLTGDRDRETDRLLRR